MKSMLLIAAAFFAAAPARAWSIYDMGTKQHPPKCALPRGLAPALAGRPDDVMCQACNHGQGVKADGYCGQCPSGQGVLASGACGQCPDKQVVVEGGKCGKFVSEAEKAEELKKAKAAQAAAEKAAAEREKKRKDDEKALAACKSKCGVDLSGGCRGMCDAQYGHRGW